MKITKAPFKNPKFNSLWYRFLEYTGTLDQLDFEDRLYYAKEGLVVFENNRKYLIDFINFQESRISRVGKIELVLHVFFVLYIFASAIFMSVYLFFLIIPWILITSVVFSTNSSNNRKKLKKFLHNDSYVYELANTSLKSENKIRKISEDFQNGRISKSLSKIFKKTVKDIEKDIVDEGKKLESILLTVKGNLSELISEQIYNQEINFKIIHRNIDKTNKNLSSLSKTVLSNKTEIVDLLHSLQETKINNTGLGDDYIQRSVFVEFDKETIILLYDNLKKFFDENDHDLLLKSLRGEEIREELFFNGSAARFVSIFRLAIKSEQKKKFKEDLIRYFITNYKFNKAGEPTNFSTNTIRTYFKPKI